MQNIQPPPDVIFSIPADLPIPLDDGACEHLENMLMPNVSLWSTDDQEINLSCLSGWNVIFCYPMTGSPGFSIPEGWVQIPGADGCTPQACSYRDNHTELKRNGVGVYGILEPDVIAAFPNAEAVNEALRYLIEVARRTNSLTQRPSGLR